MNLINQLNQIKIRRYSADIFLTKIFFIIAICFFYSTCFAGPKDEKERLDTINAYINGSFDPIKKSPSRVAHDMIIKSEQNSNTQFNLVKTYALLDEVIIDKVTKQFKDEKFFNIQVNLGKSFYEGKSNIYNYFAAYADAENELLRQKASEDFLINPLIQAMINPKGRFLSCTDYALYAYFSIIFDIMNQQAVDGPSHPTLFTHVALVMALSRTEFDLTKEANPNTGDHVVIVVQGASKTRFLIDPWINKVVELPNTFPLLSSSFSNISQQSSPNILGAAMIANSEKSITPLYKVDSFYDMLYVSPKTEWVMLTPFSQHLRQLITEKNTDIAHLYLGLKLIFDWKIPYDELFHTKSEEKKENKKT